MQKIFRRLSAALLCLALLAAPALAAEATIRSDYVVIEGENFVADTFCGVDALYNETGRTLFCNELIERFYSAVYGVSMYTDNGSLTVTSPSGCWFEVTYAPQPGDIAYASAEARERYGNHYAIVKSVDEAGGTVTLFEQNWIWDGKAGVNRVIPYDGGCYTFYTMMSASGRAAAAEEGLANTPVSDRHACQRLRRPHRVGQRRLEHHRHALGLGRRHHHPRRDLRHHHAFRRQLPVPHHPPDARASGRQHGPHARSGGGCERPDRRRTAARRHAAECRRQL